MGLKFNPFTGQIDVTGAAGGGGGANTDLSNLASTAINTDLVFDLVSPSNAFIKTKDSSTDPTAVLWLRTGDVSTTGADDSGSLRVKSGDITDVSNTGTTGALYVESGYSNSVTGAAGTGSVNFGSGYTYDGNSGDTWVYSGDIDNDGTSGDIYLASGYSANGIGNSGTLHIYSGDVNSGNSGNIALSTGASVSGSRGIISMDASSIDMSASAGPLRVPVLAADPGSLVDGDLWYNSTDDKLRIRANGITVDLN